MPAPKGNQFWKARSSHGRDKIFADSQALWEACCEYFQWVEDNPLWEDKPFHFQGTVVCNRVEKMRAMTLSGLCVFLDIDRGTWNAWRSVEDFSKVVSKVDEIIYNQKFAGASADLLNANIIARDLGLRDKVDTDLTNSDGSLSPKISITTLDPIEAARQYQEIMGGK